MHSRTPSRTTSSFPPDAWRIAETAFDPGSHFLHETLFALGNGYIGLRATHEEGGGPAGQSLDGTYLNGFYESEAIHYPEGAYGLAKNNQFMLNVPNGKGITLLLEDERFDLLQGKVIAYERTLDFRKGILERTLEWESPGGRRVAIRSQRLVSFTHKHLYALRYDITPLNFRGRIRLTATLDGEVRNMQAGDDPRVGSATSGAALQLTDTLQRDGFAALLQHTKNSGFSLVSALGCRLEHEAVLADSGVARDGQRLQQWYVLDAEQGQRVCLTRFGVYFSSRDHAADELMTRADRAVADAAQLGFAALCAQQEQFLAAFWQYADIEIDGDDSLQQGVRFNEFHLLQSVGRDGKTNIAAKGVTGEGYEGHYFWDTEIYVFPFFLYTRPDIARKLLEYRYSGLEKARERARALSHSKGALYPWRTIAGEECSAYFLAGTAQYHINADIAYSIKSYWEATGDTAFMLQYGAEVVLETARIWTGIGCWQNGVFHINGVTGPDEYTALVNNNYYTNAMAQMHLRFAAQLTDELKAHYPQEFARLAQAIDLTAEEILQWRTAAAQMNLPYDQTSGIHPQDDSFLSKKTWDFAATPREHYPLLLHYHPLVIYRHQVCKQADVVLALLLLGDRFSLEDKRRDFDYYERVTTHDSSLSGCIFSIIAAETGYAGKAYDYFMETARLDLDNTHGNTQHGVHPAAMAGTWMGIVYGFAGMRVYSGALSFAPALPEKWRQCRFKIAFQGRLLGVQVGHDSVEYRLLDGETLTFRHHAQSIRLTREEPLFCIDAQASDASPSFTSPTTLRNMEHGHA